jgi:hypothetical protein
MKLICGMHRSGTSLVAQIAHAAGVDFGDSETFWPADAWNPNGYFEQKDIIAVNKKLINGRLGKAHYLRPPSEALISKRAEKCSAELKLLALKYSNKVVKENRFCMTLDEWLKAGANITRILVVIRDPASVARSLRKRNHVPAVVSNRLWHEHLSRLEKSIIHIPRQYFWFDDFVNNPAGTHSGLKKLAWLTGLNTAALQGASNGMIRYSNTAPQPLSKGLRSKAYDLYTELVRKTKIDGEVIL